MANTTLASGRTFILSDKPITSFYLIIDGSVTATYSGGSYTLSTGDIIGCLEFAIGHYQCTYTTQSDCTFESYPFAHINSFFDLLSTNLEFATKCFTSCTNQFTQLAKHCANILLEAPKVTQFLQLDYKVYQAFCQKYYIDCVPMPALLELEEYTPTLQLPSWQDQMCTNPNTLDSEFNTPGMILSVMKELNTTAVEYMAEIKNCASYLSQAYNLYTSTDSLDFMQLYESILLQKDLATNDAKTIQDLIHNRLSFMNNSPLGNSELIATKTAHFNSITKSISEPIASEDDFVPSLSRTKILDYSTLSPETKIELNQTVELYKAFAHKPIDDDSHALRAKLTKLYFELYENLFFTTLEKTDIPIEVLMFLSFGYLDEVISGTDNAVKLSKYIKATNQLCGNGIYTLYHWLLAIYHGEKEPSRNEFDEDYSVYLRGQHVKGDITKEEEQRLLTDHREKTRYELRNMFPTVNKMTFGRISIYCPIFTENQVSANFSDNFISKDIMQGLLRQVQDIDFKVFYRETFTTLEFLNNIKYEINVAYTPDIILMPCVGNRGVMWQEIEGKRRNTPARFMFPIFHVENLESSFLHVIGEYRWEMCKRVQGARWNDVSERSLTSEYCDYLQFYKKNVELSADAKEKIKLSLIKARNNFKELFAREYITWITAESSGSPRLNKQTRNILFAHCTFAATIRTTLAASPLYSEQLSRYEIQLKQRLHKCQNIITKYQSSGKPIPIELEKELEYIKK